MKVVIKMPHFLEEDTIQILYLFYNVWYAVKISTYGKKQQKSTMVKKKKKINKQCYMAQMLTFAKTF